MENMEQPTPTASKLPRQLCCLLLSLVDHVQCSSVPRVLNGTLFNVVSGIYAP
jgi:hypothetical protein